MHLTAAAELLLFYASRSQNIAEKIQPALAAGDVVVCDRFYHASMAYQGYGRGIPLEFIEKLTELVAGACRPELTILLDIEPETGLRRARARNNQRAADGGRSELDEGRFEMEDLLFYARVRNGYLDLARREPGRIVTIPADRAIEAVHRDIVAATGL
jgi:dTMP kinase